ncbi:MAG: helix-turn-helix domain-containing protein [Pontimonas sp.]
MTNSAVTAEPAVFQPEAYIPSSLAGMVDVIAQLEQDQPARRLVMPGGKVELALFLEGSDITEFYMGFDGLSARGPRKDFSLLFSVTNRPQIVSAKKINIMLVLMSPAAAMLIFGVPASELTNRSISPESLGINMAPLQDELNALPTFSARARLLEQWLLRRLAAGPDNPGLFRVSKNLVALFGDDRLLPDSEQVMDLTGYSRSHADRLAKQWLGLTVEQYGALHAYRRALRLLNEPMSLAEVAVTAGYFDQAHFTRTFTRYSGITPGEYRRTPQTGIDTLQLD